MREVFEKQDVVPLVAEVFRELGFEGASMSAITARTKLSKGSLYHFFPGGKEQMAAEILAHVDAWFVREVFEPLEEGPPQEAIARMWKSVDAYFQSGRRICLIGAFALDETRDRFAGAIRGYFKRWVMALESALVRHGMETRQARAEAEVVVIAIQGALTVARALNDKAVFGRNMRRSQQRLAEGVGNRTAD